MSFSGWVLVLGVGGGSADADWCADFVESTGQWDSDEIFLEAVGILKAKVNRLRRHTLKMIQQEAERADQEATVEDEDAMEE